mmetsp:Transcript_4679/g.18696  ORF Transcript_4679/g.18696 Transcript_4679/m.18696 type:complete len:83 (+) Transcript_4679:1152-1400(+)
MGVTILLLGLLSGVGVPPTETPEKQEEVARDEHLLRAAADGGMLQRMKERACLAASPAHLKEQTQTWIVVDCSRRRGSREEP